MPFNTPRASVNLYVANVVRELNQLSKGDKRVFTIVASDSHFITVQVNSEEIFKILGVPSPISQKESNLLIRRGLMVWEWGLPDKLMDPEEKREEKGFAMWIGGFRRIRRSLRNDFVVPRGVRRGRELEALPA